MSILNLFQDCLDGKFKVFSFVDAKSYDESNVLFSLQNILDLLSSGKQSNEIRNIFKGDSNTGANSDLFKKQIDTINMMFPFNKDRKELVGIVRKHHYITYEQLVRVLFVCQHDKIIELMLKDSDALKRVLVNAKFTGVELINYSSLQQMYLLINKNDGKIAYVVKEHFDDVKDSLEEPFECEELNYQELLLKIKEWRKANQVKGRVGQFQLTKQSVKNVLESDAQELVPTVKEGAREPLEKSDCNQLLVKKLIDEAVECSDDSEESDSDEESN